MTDHLLRAERAITLEGLEDRLFLSAAPTVTAVTADNRGEVTIQLSEAVTGVSKSSVKLFTPGANGAIGDADDVRQPSQVVYTAATHRITIKGKLAANTGYRIRVQASFVKGLDGKNLDGEFTGKFPSGDGQPGGNFAFIAKKDKSVEPTARLSTSDGNMNVLLLGDKAPNAVANFLSYVNAGSYDEMFWTNLAKGVLLQGGEVQLTAGDKYQAIPTQPEIMVESSVSNLRGTLAYAHTPTNGENDGFFINIANNDGSGKSANLDHPPSGPAFTVFAKLKSASDLAVLDTTGAKGTVNLGSLGQTTASSIPVNDVALAAKSFVPSRDLIIVRRIAVLDKITALV